MLDIAPKFREEGQYSEAQQVGRSRCCSIDQVSTGTNSSSTSAREESVATKSCMEVNGERQEGT